MRPLVQRAVQRLLWVEGELGVRVITVHIDAFTMDVLSGLHLDGQSLIELLSVKLLLLQLARLATEAGTLAAALAPAERPRVSTARTELTLCVVGGVVAIILLD